MISTAGDATLSVADPSSTNTGQLVNGAFALAQPLQASASSLGGTRRRRPGRRLGRPTSLLNYGGPVSNDSVTLTFKQTIGANGRAAHRRVQQDADVHAEHDDLAP